MNLTTTVVRAFIAEYGVSEARSIVKEWLACFPRQRAERLFARRLQRDYGELFGSTQQREASVADALIGDALRRVRWREVARALIDRFAPVRPWPGMVG